MLCALNKHKKRPVNSCNYISLMINVYARLQGQLRRGHPPLRVDPQGRIAPTRWRGEWEASRCRDEREDGQSWRLESSSF